MTALEATYTYVSTLQKLGYSKARIDQAFREVSASHKMEAPFIEALKADIEARQRKAGVEA